MTHDFQVMFETLEVGTDGIVLRTNSPSEVVEMHKFLHKWDAAHETLVECEVKSRD